MNQLTAHNILHMEPSPIVMWRPYCLTSLSHVAKRYINEIGRTEYMRFELYALDFSMSVIEYLVRSKVEFLSISYGSFLWQQEHTLKQFHEFFPCSKFDFDYVPSQDNFYEENEWHVHGSIRNFATGVDPLSLGYNVEEGTCNMSVTEDLSTWSVEDKLLLKRLAACEAYLSLFNGVQGRDR